MGIVVVQSLVLQVLGLAALALEVWALVEAVRFRKESYPAAGKQTKVLWVTILAVASALGFVYFRSPLALLSVMSVAAAGAFMAGVRPALRSLQGRGGRGPSSGPYGGW